MRGLIMIAEYATIHADQTLTVVRAGFKRLRLSKPVPAEIKGHLVVRLIFDPADAGTKSSMLVRVVGPERDVLSQIERPFEVQAGKRGAYFLFHFSEQITRLGGYTFDVAIGNEPQDAWALEVEAYEEPAS